MRVYIASSLLNAESVRHLRNVLIQSGHTITYDWTLHGRVYGARLRHVAVQELNVGVQTADILIALLPGGPGTHTEIGFALGLGKPVVLVAEDPKLLSSESDTTSMAYHHPGILARLTETSATPDAIRRYLKDFVPALREGASASGERRESGGLA